jgi:hypothetical protein
MQISRVSEFIKKAQDITKENKMDLSSGEDLSLAIMNLVALEEHFFFTSQKTKSAKYVDLLKTAREMRKDLMAKLVKDPEGEVWCISKHLLAASMRLMEVGTKALGRGMKKEAADLFHKSYELYTLFWGLNLKLVDIGDVKKIDNDTLNVKDKGKTNFLGKMGNLINKIVDCCIE